MKKTLAAITLAGSIALIGAIPAVAADHYPAPPANAAVSDGVVGPGSQFVFRGHGFKAGEGLVIKVTPGTKPASTGASVNGRGMGVSGKITLPLAPQQHSANADGSGAFALPISISETGVYTLTATGLESGVTASASITVEGAAVAAASTTTSTSTSASTSGLANTGADSNLMIWSLVGAGALAAGVTSVVVVRRRAKADATA
ncbi:LPXTG-motif cell wall anchor domain-containing protein [Arthrobacter sp. ok909]|uniref:LPXTG cell wall anchor domain-containing protein n=1 Tax=Arthrobacter sp. ok909 TaxID=1761746 RepID=UPI00088016E2|nr:LPXTG cell wall anchor domain-containing protein [Arthrobacter sp. ok909]SDP24987.1 LPXTG-motif cell wall anchor domain-containing protein [Arthrobacter sp. ok909]